VADEVAVAVVPEAVVCLGTVAEVAEVEEELVVLTHTLHLCFQYRAHLAPTVFLAVAVPVALPVAEVAEELVVLVLLLVAFLAVAMVAVAVLAALPGAVLALSLVRVVLQVVGESMVLSSLSTNR